MPQFPYSLFFTQIACGLFSLSVLIILLREAQRRKALRAMDIIGSIISILVVFGSAKKIIDLSTGLRSHHLIIVTGRDGTKDIFSNARAWESGNRIFVAGILINSTGKAAPHVPNQASPQYDKRLIEKLEFQNK